MLLRMCTLLVLVAACGGGDQSADPTSSSIPETDSTTTSTSRSPEDPDASFPTNLDEDLIGQVRSLAGEQAGVEPDVFEVEAAAEVTWSDGSLGCPQPGEVYTQALVDGYWVVLTHEDESYDYRATSSADWRRCLDGSPPTSINAEG